MKHLDLFSGIGGFALATEMVWENVEHVFCDNEPFSQAILKKHWPHAKIIEDIRQVTPDSIGCGHVHGESQEQPTNSGQQALSKSSTGCGRFNVDIITGGFPCQPFSQAGRRRGTEDSRHLWPEMLRVIREFHPRWVIGENVGGLVTWSEGLVLEQIHTDLESEGYEVQAFIIPAVSLNAPHRRDRIWIVAHAASNDARGTNTKLSGQNEQEQETRPNQRVAKSCRTNRTTSDSEHGRSRNSEFGGYDQRTPARATRPNTNDSNSPFFIEERGKQKGNSRGRPERQNRNDSWNENWVEVATRLCRMDDGIPRRLDRNPRLKALGNAIVPQVAAEIMGVIKKVDDKEKAGN